MDFLDRIQTRFKQANMVEKLIYVNIAVFFLTFIFNTLSFLFELHTNFLIDWFCLPADFNSFIQKPWTIISYGFLHKTFLHILLNLIALFFIGNLFLEYFTAKKLLYFYLFGTFFGGVIFMLSYRYFPALRDNSDAILLGASAGISAIFVGIATHMPNYELKIRFIGFVKLWYLAAIWVVLDLVQIPVNNPGGHLSHLGGALFGFLYIRQTNNAGVRIWSEWVNFFKKKQKPLKTVYKSHSNKKSSTKNTNKNQEKIDAILDKISKSGYDALNKEEKSFLFKQGK